MYKFFLNLIFQSLFTRRHRVSPSQGHREGPGQRRRPHRQPEDDGVSSGENDPPARTSQNDSSKQENASSHQGDPF
jgi:hypothetical protein